MKVIILAAGRGNRMRPLTDTTPKPLLKVLGKELLVHLLDQLLENVRVTSIAIVSGYKSEQIVRRIGTQFHNVSVTHVIQEKPTGTYDAAFLGAQALSLGPVEPIIIAHADDLQDGAAFRRASGYPYCIIVARSDNPRAYGVITINTQGIIQSIEEKPEFPKSNLVNTGGIVATRALFHSQYTPKRNGNGERYITDAVATMIMRGTMYRTERAGRWNPVTTPEDLDRLNQ